MSGKRKIISIIFFALTIVDLYCCFLPGQEFSQILRPVLILVLLILVLQKVRFSAHYLLITFSLLITAISEYIFTKYGPSSENIIILLIITKNTFFTSILYQDIKSEFRPTLKLFRWLLNYLLFTVAVCFLMNGFENWLTYVIAIQSGVILLFISLQKKHSDNFRQLYMGFSLITFSLIFGKILLTDSRWFVEALARFCWVIGHYLFVSGLVQIRLVADTKNSFENQAIKQPIEF